MSVLADYLSGRVPGILLVLLVQAIITAIASAQAGLPSDPTVDNGAHGYDTYDGAHDKISLSSGNLSFCISLVSLKGPNNHNLTIPLCYNSQFQEVYDASGIVGTGDALAFFPWVWAPNTPSGDTTPPMGPGWSLIGFAAYYESPSTSLVGLPIGYMPDGTRYSYAASGPGGPDEQNGDTYLVNSSLQMPDLQHLATQTILLKNGTRFYISTSGGSPACSSSVCAEETFPDSPGAYIKWTPSSVTDLVGRTVTESSGSNFSGSNTKSSTAYIQFQYPVSNGSATVVVQMTTMQFGCASNRPGYNNSYNEVGSGGYTNSQDQYIQTEGPYSMPTAVILPNGLTYTFQYDTCGMLRKVSYPTGGYTRFDYSAFARTYIDCNGTGSACGSTYYINEVTEKHVCSIANTPTSGYADTCGQPENTTAYSPTVANPAGGANSENSVTDPLGNRVVYQFSPPIEGDGEPDIPALETSRQYYDSSGNLLKTVTTQYSNTTSPGSTSGGSPVSTYNDPVLPTIQTTTIDNGMVAQIQWSYDFSDPFSNDSVLTEERAYDYGPGTPGSLIQRTDYTWLHRDNPAVYGWGGSANWAITAHVCDRKTSEKVYDGSGKLIAWTKYVSDNGNPPSPGTGALLTSAYGLLTSVSIWRNTDGAWLATNYQYGAYGNVTQMTDPKGNSTTYDYTDNYTDGIDRSSNAFLTKMTDALGHLSQSQYYWGSGLVAASCGANFSGTCAIGLTSKPDYASYAYDIMGRETSAMAGDGGQTITCYSDTGGTGCAQQGYPLQVTTTQAISSGVNRISTAILDGEGRTVTSELNTDPSCPGGSVNDDTVYDGDGRVYTVTNPYCSNNPGAPTAGTTTYSYDGLGRTTRVTHPDGSYTTNGYAGRAVLSADEGRGASHANPIQRISQMDALGRLIYVCEVTGQTQQGTSNSTPSSCGLDISETGFLTTYGYDASNSNGPLDSLTSVSQGAVSRSFTYDSLGELLSATNPESGTTTYIYDNDGNLTSKTAPLENQSSGTVTTTYAYDNVNRILSELYTDDTTPSACFQYDQNASGNGIGRLTGEWTQMGSCSSSPPSSGVLTERLFAAYDAMGRLTADEQCALVGNCTGAGPYSLNYSYDLAGDVTTFNNGLTGNSDLSLTSQYNSAGRLTEVNGPKSAGNSETEPLFIATGYTPSGALSDALFGIGPAPGITFHRDYDSRLLPIDETDTVATTPGTATLQITGSEQMSAYSNGSITFSGSEQQSGSTYDSGTILIAIGASQPIQLTYGQNSTSGSLASTLASLLNSCANDGVEAVSNGATVYLQSCAAGTNTGYSISVTPDGHNSSFPQYSFAATPSGSTMTPIINPTTLSYSGIAASFSTTGSGQIGTGLFTFLVFPSGGGQPVYTNSLSWSSTDTIFTLASRLATSIGSCANSGAIVGALASGPSVYLISCQAGNSYVFSGGLDYSNGSAGFQVNMTNTPASAAVPGITFSGNEQSGQSGTFLVTISTLGSQGAPQQVAVNWGSSSTPGTLATSLASGLGSCSTNGNGMVGLASGVTVYLGACQMSATYTISAPIVGCACSSGPPDFTAMVTTTPATGQLPPVPGATYDSGTVTLSVNGTQIATATYGGNSTPEGIASALASGGAGNNLVALQVNGSSLTMTAIGDGTATDYAYQITASSSQPATFTSPSFIGSPGSSSLQGGTNAPLYNWAINSYAPDGDVLSMTDAVMGSWSYAYDDFNRLTGATAAAGVDNGLMLGWTYDRYGNRWAQNATGTGYASAVQPQLSFTGDNNRVDGWSYDDAGNLLNDNRNVYTYDAEGRVAFLNGQPEYVYDAEGRRVAKLSTNGIVTSTYLLDLAGNQVTELNSSGQWAHTNVYAGGRLFGTYEGPAGPAPNTWHFHLKDWLGTNRMQTNAAGNEEERCYSYPFGDGLLCTGTAPDATEHHFTGKERDTESGLDYFEARYLNSNLGRFMTPDWSGAPTSVPYATFGEPQSLNLYTYVANNPNTGIDADGHDSGTDGCWTGCGNPYGGPPNVYTGGDYCAPGYSCPDLPEYVDAAEDAWNSLGTIEQLSLELNGIGPDQWANLTPPEWSAYSYYLNGILTYIGWPSITIVRRGIRSGNGFLSFAGHTALSFDVVGIEAEVLGKGGKGGGAKADQEVRLTMGPNHDAKPEDKIRAADSRSHSDYKVWVTWGQYMTALNGTLGFIGSTCPSCGGNYHLNTIPMRNSNTFTFNMLYGVGVAPPAVGFAPGYSKQDGNWYR